ncbi:MAG: exonuclease domain-containing protein [Eubacterium sp.]|nr:exonuclease domain-containing protein [Eubacterium sp.]
MNYIVLDLEWNQSPIGQAGEHPRMPFEIIEIGAIKLNEKFEILSEFRRLICPKLYTKFHKYIKDMLNYTEKDLKAEGVGFKVACGEFLDWCSQEGDDYEFCTWGGSDLSYLQNNMDFYHMDKLSYPLKYYDIQQIYADRYSKDGNICKLEKAIDYLRINNDRPFHAAINDAYYTARVMQVAKLGKINDKYTFDLYRHPKKHEDAIVAFHNGIIDQISEEYPSRNDAMADSEISTILCPKCGRKTSRRVKWFQLPSGTELSVGKCFLHGNIMATIKLKPASDSSDSVFVVKKVVPISKTKFKEIKDKKDIYDEKKRERDRRYKERLNSRESSTTAERLRKNQTKRKNGNGKSQVANSTAES